MKFIFFSLFLFQGVLFANLGPQKNPMNENIVVITGVTKGLGKALAIEFNERGWTVAGCARSLPLIENLRTILGPKHFLSVVDITSSNAVNQWATEVKDTLGFPNIIINNAAVINESMPLWQVSEGEFKDCLSINVIGTFNILHSFIPFLIQNKKGLIINISSEWGRNGAALFGPYSASKFAVEGLTQSLSKELPKGITVVSLDPGGGINTDMLKKAYPKEASYYPTASERAKDMVSYILKISQKDNGKALTAP